MPRSYPVPPVAALATEGATVFAAILNRCGLTQQSTRLQVFLAWKPAVGPIIAARTEVASFGRGVLMIKAANATWQQELTYCSRTIIEKMNGILGGHFIDVMKIRHGRLQAKRSATPGATPPPPSRHDHARAHHAALAIADPELRATFARAMAKGCALRGGPRPRLAPRD